MSTTVIMDLASLIYNYDAQRHQPSDEQRLRSEIMKIIEDNDMQPLYNDLADKYAWEKNETFSETLRVKNENELKTIEDKIEDASKNAGDTEVINSLLQPHRILITPS